MHGSKQMIYVVSLLLFLWSADCASSDGVLEINQACAVNGGCFDGDTAGFPVTITSPGSYQLTGNLDTSSSPDTSAVFVDSILVTLDLGGFAIQGPVTCTGLGGGLSCSGSTSGFGVETTSTAEFFSLRNGTIRGMGGGGLSTAGNGAIVVEVKAIENNGIGMNIDRQSVLRDCIAVRNAGDGINVNAASVVERCTSVQNLEHGYELVESVLNASVARGNGGTGVVGALSAVVSETISTSNSVAGFVLEPRSRFVSNVSSNNVSPDSCGGGVCSERRRYYKSITSHNGASASTSCAEGFHMASLWEILDTSRLQYDMRLGKVLPDSGDGPPAGDAFGWVRTGGSPSGAGDGAGLDNCQAWSSNSEFSQGSAVNPWPLWDRTMERPDRFENWQVNTSNCNLSLTVWCIED